MDVMGTIITVGVLIIVGLLKWVSVQLVKVRNLEDTVEKYKNDYHEAKEAWANQSNAIREKQIEVDKLERENRKLRRE